MVGCELATAWRALGSEVVQPVRGSRLLPRMEPFAGELVAERLRASGVDVRFGASVTAVHRDGPLTLTLDGGETVTADEVLFATGRVLGVTFVGAGVAELLHSATIAVTAEVPISRLWHAVPSFPTLSEVWLRLLETYRDRTPAPPAPRRRHRSPAMGRWRNL